MELAFAPGTTIRAGETLEREGFVAWEGSYEVRVQARERDGAPIELGPATGKGRRLDIHPLPRLHRVVRSSGSRKAPGGG